MHLDKCQLKSRGTAKQCEFHFTAAMKAIIDRKERGLAKIANTLEGAELYIGKINTVMFNEKMDKGDPKDSRKSRVEISLGEREGVLKELKTLIRVLGLPTGNYVKLSVYLDNVFEREMKKLNKPIID